MNRNRHMARLGALLLGAVFAASAWAQQPAPAAPAPQAVNPIAPGAIQALKDMGAYLQTLQRFSVVTQVTGERVLADGQKLQHSAKATMEVARPNRLRARIATALAERELIYNGKVATLYAPAQKKYSSVEVSDNLTGLVRRLQERYGIEVPLADLFLWGTADAPLDTIESAMNAGQDIIGNDLCDHFAFRQGKLDWQVWIKAGAQPLPRKLVITNRSDDARPQSVSTIEWDLKPTFKDAIFTWVPSPGAQRVEIVPLKTR
jgi:hypothetical protein